MMRVAVNTLIVLGVLLGIYVLWQLRAAALLFVLSLAVAASLRPGISWLARRGFPHMAALTATYLVVFGALGLLLIAAAAPLAAEVQQFGDDFVLAYQTLFDRVKDVPPEQAGALGVLPPPDDLFVALAGEQGAALLQTVLGATFSLFSMAIDLVIVVFLGVYWSIDQVRFERLWLSLLPVDQRRAARDLWRAIESELGAYLRSEVVQSIAASLLLWLGYRVMHQPYPVLLAVSGALAWLIPWVGVLLAVGLLLFFSAPTLLIDAPSALVGLLPAVGYTAFVLLVLELYVEPRFFDRRRYNALITAIIIFGMADIAGVMGLVLGAPVATALQIAGRQWMRWWLSLAAEAPTEASFRERLATVRAALARRKRPAPELANLVDRLSTLVDDAETLLDHSEAPQPAATV